MGRKSINIVWFRRDLRLDDHAPLAEACNAGLPVLLLYLFEPELMNHPDSDARHWRFVWQSLENMNRMLTPPQCMQILKADALDVLDWLAQRYDIKNIYSHQETGLEHIRRRDEAVNEWCQHHKVRWTQHEDKGVRRGLTSLDHWEDDWQSYVDAEVVTPDLESLTPVLLEENPYELSSFQDLAPGVIFYDKNFQPGGSTPGHFYLQSFIEQRGFHYDKNMDDPLASRISTSRLSPYLAYGNLSLRQVYQSAKMRLAASQEMRSCLKHFLQRLMWHSHFLQILEMQPDIETDNVNSGYNPIRKIADDEVIKAWEQGATGFPLVDACMRCVQQTGHLNFKMRAILVNFFTHHLWQPWQEGVHHLARLFLDYEPGVHYAQFQMQAGVTGIHPVQVYNPVQESKTYDKAGEFIQKWLPELRHLPAQFLHEPWKMSRKDQELFECIIGKDYPAPILILEATSLHAKEVLSELKSHTLVKDNNQYIMKRLNGLQWTEETGLQFNWLSLF